MASRRGVPRFLSVLLLALLVSSETVPPESEEVEDTCPAAGAIAPCTCRPDYDGSCIVQCYGVGDEAVRRLAGVANLCKGHVDFVLIHSTVRAIPRRLWEVLLSSSSVDITIEYSKVEYLLPPEEEPLPELYTPGEAIIKIYRVADIGKWQWGQLRNFVAAGELTVIIDITPLTELSADFAHIGRGAVRKVTIDQTQLADLPDGIFKNFNMVYSLSIQDNQLTEVKRSLFPQPAPKLQYLHLNGNFLKSLPDDIFADMPSLEIVYLRENDLTSLPENIFKSVTSRNLKLIDFVNNPWRCDCKLMWVSDGTTLFKNMGTCTSPEDLVGKKVTDLKNLLTC